MDVVSLLSSLNFSFSPLSSLPLFLSSLLRHIPNGNTSLFFSSPSPSASPSPSFSLFPSGGSGPLTPLLSAFVFFLPRSLPFRSSASVCSSTQPHSPLPRCAGLPEKQRSHLPPDKQFLLTRNGKLFFLSRFSFSLFSPLSSPPLTHIHTHRVTRSLAASFLVSA